MHRSLCMAGALVERASAGRLGVAGRGVSGHGSGAGAALGAGLQVCVLEPLLDGGREPQVPSAGGDEVGWGEVPGGAPAQYRGGGQPDTVGDRADAQQSVGQPWCPYGCRVRPGCGGVVPDTPGWYLVVLTDGVRRWRRAATHAARVSCEGKGPWPRVDRPTIWWETPYSRAISAVLRPRRRCSIHAFTRWQWCSSVTVVRPSWWEGRGNGPYAFVALRNVDSLTPAREAISAADSPALLRASQSRAWC